MAMTRVGLRDSNKSLPADIRVAFAPRTYYGQGWERLNRNADVVQSDRHWGVNGLGDTCFDLDYQPFECAVGVGAGGTVDYLQWDNGNPIQASVIQPDPSTGGVDAAAIAKIIAAGTAGLVPIIAATSQGVLYKVDPKTGAMTVYSQPAGSNVNLPIGGNVGTINTPFGSATASGFGGGQLAMVALIGLLAVMAFKR